MKQVDYKVASSILGQLTGFLDELESLSSYDDVNAANARKLVAQLLGEWEANHHNLNEYKRDIKPILRGVAGYLQEDKQ